ncbi:MAG: aldehyde ferredoxin oxidoreductase family protein [Chloroflexota bacterium]|nr:aldehyde ferredoxin oxidoreductase family protein [Chloroflexota bacterium]
MEDALSGYMGKLLRVDLSSGTIEDEPLNPDWARQFVGGSALAARYLYDLVTPQTDPLGADNPLMFMTGPLVGTAAPSCGRYVVCARSPLTGIWGESNSGGYWGPELKFAGYDGTLLTGRAAHPVYLWIKDGVAELRDANHLWGQDSYQTQESIRQELSEPKARVACIGPAGENGVKYAAVMNDHGRAAGRTGMGTVMGSKNLKAVAVRGTGSVPLTDGKAFKDYVQQAREAIKEDIAAEVLRLMGTAGSAEMLMMFGDMPSRYFTGDDMDVTPIGGATMAETILVKGVACYRCPIACGRLTDVSKRYGLSRVDGPEYETVATYGSLLLVDDLPAITYANHLCNRYGLDTITGGVTIALAYYLYDRGIINAQDTGGLELHWGDSEAAIRLTEMIAYREGFGDLLAEGSLAVARHFGVEDLAVQVNGLEVPMHDPRASFGMAVNYSTGPRGACHNQGDMYLVDQGQQQEELGIVTGERFESSAEKAQITARQQDWRTLYNAMIMCVFANPPASITCGMLNAATGRELPLDGLLSLGERAFNLKRALNVRLGLGAANDRLPKLLLQPLAGGGTEGRVPDVDLLMREYYAWRGWDPVTGKPTRERLVALGLADVAEDLWP